MTDQERKRYKRFLHRLHDIASENFTKEVDFVDALKNEHKKGVDEGMKEGRKEGMEQGIEKVAIALIKKNVSDDIICSTTGLSLQQLAYLKQKI